MTQYLDFPTPEITTGVLTNCATKMYFQAADSRVASRLGEDLGSSYATDGTKTRHYKDGSTWEAPVSQNNPYADELKELEVGQCYIRRGTKNTRVDIEQLPDPYGNESMTTYKVKLAIDKILARSEYHTPDADEDNSPTPNDDKPVDGSIGDALPDDDDPLGIL